MSATPASRTDQAAPTVVVVGAGIAGLAAAAELRRRLPDATVLVLEASEQVGGKLRLAEVGGTTADVGAESILNRRPEGVALARQHGMGDDVVHPETIEARIWSRGRMHPMPRSLMGVPTDTRPLAETGLVSRHGVARAALDRVLPETDIGDTDVSVGWLIEQRLGREVLDRLVEPLLGGVYAGHAREISARAAAPQIVALLGRDRSLMNAAAQALAPAAGEDGEPVAPPPVFAGIRGGVGRLAHRIAEDLDVRLCTTVRDLVPSGDLGWQVVTGPASAPELVEADAVVVAVPANAAARLLAGPSPAAAYDLSQIEHASMAVITLAFPRTAFPPVEGSGFLVPPVDGRRIKAATYSSAKWGWVRDADPDLFLMRTSVGRHREEAELQVADEELVERALADLTDAVGLSVRPVDQHVQRWGGGLPQYAVGHRDRVARIRHAVAGVPGLAVCGAAYDGLGIPACIASAHQAVELVVADLERTHPGTAGP